MYYDIYSDLQGPSKNTIVHVPKKTNSSPVQGYCCHRVNTSEDSCYWKEVVKSAVNKSEVPLVVHCIHKVNNGIESRHGSLCERKID